MKIVEAVGVEELMLKVRSCVNMCHRGGVFCHLFCTRNNARVTAGGVVF